MSSLDKKYSLRLDLKFNYTNSIMKFDEFDINTSDFFIRITRDKELIDISEAIVTLVAIKPDGTVESQFVTITENNVYCDLKNSMKDIPGKYEAIASITLNGETINTDPTNPIVYEVTENKFLRQLDAAVVSEERFSILTEMINRLSTIENDELSRQEAELSREEAEKLRQEAIGKVKADTTKLISDTKKEIADYKDAKDTAINDDLAKYKEATNKAINDYKSDKDTELNKIFNNYKTDTTNDIEEFKNTKSRELDAYKNTKNTEIDNYTAEKDLEIDTYVASKNKELDKYVSTKNTEINGKLKEVDTAEKSRVVAEQKRQQEHVNREQFLNGFESQLEQIETKNTEQDTRLKQVEYKNKVQDVYINGLFNENSDGRLSIEGEGNNIKLEGSKQGVVEIEKVVGNTLVNIISIDKPFYTSVSKQQIPNTKLNIPLKANTVYTRFYHVSKLKGGDSIEFPTLYDKVYSEPSKQYSQYIDRTGWIVSKFTNLYEGAMYSIIVDQNWRNNNTNDCELEIDKFMIFEGDLTTNHPAEHVEGMQSTFEDKLITQEMVDAGEELAENLGKYRVGVKVVSKNKCDNIGNKIADINLNTGIEVQKNGCIVSDFIMVNRDYSCSKIDEGNKFNPLTYRYYDMNKKYLGTIKPNFYPHYVRLRALGKSTDINISLNDIKFQLEEGTQTTQYEPYKEYKTSVYLNSPLTKYDEICVQNGQLGVLRGGRKDVLDDTIVNCGDVSTSFPSDNSRMFYVVKGDASMGRYLICDKFKSNIDISLSNNRNVEGAFISTQGNSIAIYFRIFNEKLATQDLLGFKQWLKNNPTTIVYKLAEPYFEPITPILPKLVSETPNNATLHIDSVIPCQSVSASYTGNAPSVYGLEKTGITNTNDIAVTQTAVDFLLMSSMGEVMMMSFKNNTKGGNNMGAYFASRIMKKALKYEDVIRKYPEFKEDIDFILRSEGYGDLIIEVQ